MKVVSAAADHLRPDVAGVVILLYHRVGGGSALEIDLDASRFEEQISAIALYFFRAQDSCPKRVKAALNRLWTSLSVSFASFSPILAMPLAITSSDALA